MDRPETRYARSDDLMIAYQVTGEGNPVDLVLAPGIVSHLDLDWEDPEDARWIEQVSSYCRFIRFDKRGTGLSDRGVYAATLEERTDDIRAVMDAAGSERAVIFGISEGGCMACVFPPRTRGAPADCCCGGRCPVGFASRITPGVSTAMSTRGS